LQYLKLTTYYECLVNPIPTNFNSDDPSLGATFGKTFKTLLGEKNKEDFLVQ
jgi:hypothetical protein